jgi:hypothetical protein
VERPPIEVADGERSEWWGHLAAVVGRWRRLDPGSREILRFAFTAVSVVATLGVVAWCVLPPLFAQVAPTTPSTATHQLHAGASTTTTPPLQVTAPPAPTPTSAPAPTATPVPPSLTGTVEITGRRSYTGVVHLTGLDAAHGVILTCDVQATLSATTHSFVTCRVYLPPGDTFGVIPAHAWQAYADPGSSEPWGFCWNSTDMTK